MDLQEVRWRGMDSIALAQMPGCCESGIETSRSIKCQEFLEQLKTFSGRVLLYGVIFINVSYESQLNQTIFPCLNRLHTVDCSREWTQPAMRHIMCRRCCLNQQTRYSESFHCSSSQYTNKQ
jgi:hypothetical protein